MTDDVFGTAGLRAAVLGTWRTSPARLREDANHEEDLAHAYRDRVVVELAQNAADAAARAGVPGRLLLELTDGPDGPVLVAANTGEPLDAAGVASLSSLRASAKRDGGVKRDGGAKGDGGAGRDDGPGDARPAGPGVVGRFGVGFAAVRAVADAVEVVSRDGAVRFDLALTAAALAEAAAGAPDLAAEAARRAGVLPVLRLPFPVPEDEARAASRPGYDTAVVLRLRDAEAEAAVRAQLAEVDDLVLLGLPGLVEVLVDVVGEPPRRVREPGERWLLEHASGELDLALVAGAPVEERSARAWRVTWALPRGEVAGVAGRGGDPDGGDPDGSDLDGGGPGGGGRDGSGRGDGAPSGAGIAAGTARVLHAPTPTDDATTLPAVLVATLPLDPTRRRVRSGPVADAVLAEAAAAYVRLAARVPDPLALVPTGFPAGEVDDRLRELVVRALAAAPVLTSAAGEPVAPEAAVALSGAGAHAPGVAAALGSWWPALVDVAPGGLAAARTLGVGVRELADLVDELPTSGPAPQDWARLYDGLTAAADDPQAREALGGLPVPLVDGRVVRGVRGLVLPGAAGPRLGAAGAAVLAGHGLRLVHADAEHPLLERLGATAPDAAGLLDHPAVRAAVLATADDDDLEQVAAVTAAVLPLLAAVVADGGGPSAAQRAWLGLLTLAAADGEPTPAHGLVLPGSVAAGLLDPRVVAPVADAEVERWGAPTLVAAGVRADLTVLTVPDVVVGEEDEDGFADALLDGWQDYLEALADLVGEGAWLAEAEAVADLDAVEPARWHEALARLATEPGLRRALLTPVRAEHGSGGSAAPSYTAWWLRERSGLGLDGPFRVGDGAGGDGVADRTAPDRAAVDRTIADDAVAGLLPAAPEVLAGLDETVQRALGGVRDLAGLAPADWPRVVDRLGGPGSPVAPAVAAALWRAWVRLAEARPEAELDLDAVPALVGPGRVELVPVERAAAAAVPMWWQRTDLAPLVPGEVADLLGLPEASGLAAGVVGTGVVEDGLVEAWGEDGTAEDGTAAGDEPGRDDGAGAAGAAGPVVAKVPDAVLRVLPGAPATWVEHDRLTVDGVEVDWWVEGRGPGARVHAVHTAGLARGLAQAAGAWRLRHLVEAVLTDPARADEEVVEAVWDVAPEAGA